MIPALKPIHYASVSGGKDSLYMLKVILQNPKKYPLDLVVNFDLEIEWPFVENVKKSLAHSCFRRRYWILFFGNCLLPDVRKETTKTQEQKK